MKPLLQLQADAAAYVQVHSAAARWAPRTASSIARQAVELLGRYGQYPGKREDLERVLVGLISPTIWLVLRWLVPIIVRLVIDWWFAELELERHIRRCSEGTD